MYRKRGKKKDKYYNPRIDPRPYKKITRDAGEAKPSTENMTFAETTLSYLRLIEDESDTEMKSILQTHLRELAEDATVYAWAAVRTYEYQLLAEIKARRIDWRDQFKVQMLRLSNTSRASKIDKGKIKQITKDKPLKPPSTDAEKITELKQQGKHPCVPYQKNECSHTTSHDKSLHVCRHCFEHPTRVRLLPHTETSCYSLPRNK